MGQTFEGGVAIVAGGSGGIGSVICEKLAGAGTHVALTYRSRPEAAEKVVDAIRANGREAFEKGSGACRESGCQSVKNSVAAVRAKKEKHYLTDIDTNIK